MKVINFSKEEQEKIMAQYANLAFANLKKNILQDLVNNRNESIIYKKYTKEQIVRMMENPQKNEEQIRQLSGFMYMISSHYRKLVDYYSTILLYNYSVVPTKIPLERPKKTEYKKCYYHVINQSEKYNLKHECSKAIKIAVRDGVFYGICYESEDSFYIRHFPHTKYAKISSIEDGVHRFSIDMAYFNGKEYLLESYGQDFVDAYYLYKGNKEKGTKGDKKKKWYEIPNGIVVKFDETNPYCSLPAFSNLVLDIMSVDDFKLLHKAKTEGDNYKVLSFKLDTVDGVPVMDFDLASKYFHGATQSLDASNWGAILSPFDVEAFTFQSTSSSARNDVSDAIETVWKDAGVTPALFGGVDISSSSAMLLATKPDEALAYSILQQMERYFNYRLKKMNLKYSFKISFSRLSIFNQDEYANRISKAASLSMPLKMEYATVLGMSPSDTLGLTYLEEDVLNLSKKVWVSPLVSSNTVSYTGSETGRPAAEDSGQAISDSNQNTRDSDANDNR